MKLASYHPDLPVIRRSYAKYADAVENMDNDIRTTLDALKADGLYDDTIIIYNSDHGGVMPRSKRFLYSSGMHCPLVIRIPEKYKHLWPAEKPGMTVDRIVSFVDMPKTWLSLAGARDSRHVAGHDLPRQGNRTGAAIPPELPRTGRRPLRLGPHDPRQAVRLLQELHALRAGRAVPGLPLEDSGGARLGAVPPGRQDRRDHRAVLRAARLRGVLRHGRGLRQRPQPDRRPRASSEDRRDAQGHAPDAA